MKEPIHPPVPFDDFTYSFDPALHGIFPSPPPLPSSADLFSVSETTDLLGFFDNLICDLEAEVQNEYGPPADPPASHGNSHYDASSLTFQSVLTRSMSLSETATYDTAAKSSERKANPRRRESTASLSASPRPDSGESSTSRMKPLLSTPQKRLNHIMSEQKRRNAIRDGYVELTRLIAPVGAPPGAGMPTRGRPKGSGSRVNGRGRGTGGFKGKSGILFRAVEYIQWLEEGKDALSKEVAKAEAAAGTRS
ncbi:hypothetical protein PHLCEN_2v2793 [Hermanssonia centrifuga]|uniref:BHLH domain-containing protein n=1 Tax=Hermanssonia centrifuga TaxID=98765 RepID=A0A2R6RI01_9APHY|nr:hypothetical protein PHLCEN_2v2793 [Hermanssonia centrifuga]